MYLSCKLSCNWDFLGEVAIRNDTSKPLVCFVICASGLKCDDVILLSTKLVLSRLSLIHILIFL
jgi:hypothetical protein